MIVRKARRSLTLVGEGSGELSVLSVAGMSERLDTFWMARLIAAQSPSFMAEYVTMEEEEEMDCDSIVTIMTWRDNFKGADQSPELTLSASYLIYIALDVQARHLHSMYYGLWSEAAQHNRSYITYEEKESDIK